MAHIEFDLGSYAFTYRGVGLATSGSLERLQKSSRKEHRWASPKGPCRYMVYT